MEKNETTKKGWSANFEEEQIKPKQKKKIQEVVLKKLPKLPYFHALNDIGEIYYKELGKFLISENRLTAQEVPILLSLAYQYQLKHAAEKSIKEEGVNVEVSNNKGFTSLQKNPAISTLRDANDTIMKYSSQLGLTPNSKEKVKTPKLSNDPVSDYLDN